MGSTTRLVLERDELCPVASLGHLVVSVELTRLLRVLVDRIEDMQRWGPRSLAVTSFWLSLLGSHAGIGTPGISIAHEAASIQAPANLLYLELSAALFGL
jgi:hypothetical protein